MGRIGNPVLQRAVVSEQQQAFAVGVESSGRIHAGHGDMILERGTASFVSELTKHTVRLVQQNQYRHFVLLHGRRLISSRHTSAPPSAQARTLSLIAIRPLHRATRANGW